MSTDFGSAEMSRAGVRSECNAALAPADLYPPASVDLPGPRSRTSSAGDLLHDGIGSSPAAAEALRGCSPSSTHRSNTTIKETVS